MKLKKLGLIILIVVCITSFCFGESNYNLTINPNKKELENTKINEEETLFILDYSNSMNEVLYNSTKYEMLLESMKIMLSQIHSDNKIGVRLYGHRWGLTPMDACRASILAVPIKSDNLDTISTVLRRYSPRGMTPITYALKQAIKKDFHTNKDKHIILITDGGENCDESPCKYAMELIKYRKDIKIDVIAFNIDNSDDLAQLECVAKVTSGKFYQADTKSELVKSLNRAFKTNKEVGAKIIHHY